MHNEPLFSVVVLSFNGIDLIGRCLDSLLAQSYDRVEIIVVDNASSDGTAEVISQNYPTVRLIRSRSNMGYAGGNNIGIRESRGDLVALLNQDTESHPAFLEEIAKAAAESCGNVGMWGPKCLYMGSPSTINSVGILVTGDLATFNRGMGELDVGQYEEPTHILGPYGAAAVYERELLRNTGLLDESYVFMQEETELALRARFAGWACEYVPKAHVHHVRSANLGIGSPVKLYYGERNRIWNAIKFLPSDRLPCSVGYTFRRYAHAVRYRKSAASKVVRAPRVSALSLARTLVRAWMDALKQLPSKYQERRLLWSEKRVPDYEVSRWLIDYSAGLDPYVRYPTK